MSVLQINFKDNVAVVLEPAAAVGRVLQVRDPRGGVNAVPLKDPIPYGHKVAIRPIAEGEHIIKYGEVIGGASRAIAPGEHVHVHNMESLRGRGDLGK